MTVLEPWGILQVDLGRVLVSLVQRRRVNFELALADLEQRLLVDFIPGRELVLELEPVLAQELFLVSVLKLEEPTLF